MTFFNKARRFAALALFGQICSLWSDQVSVHHPEEFWQGLFFSYQIERNSEILHDHPERERVMNIAMRIADHAGRGTAYNFAIIKAPVANAFALPGGFIFITDKLLDLKLSDGELAFLLGHELSHVQERHFERIQKEQTKVSFINALTTIGAAILASQAHHHHTSDVERLQRSAGPPPIKAPSTQALPPHLAPILAGNIYGTLYLLHSQRDFEHEADLQGARLALAAGYDLEDGMGMLKKLFYSNYRDNRFEEWTTHPLTQSRLLSIKSKANPLWQNKKAPQHYIDELRAEHANKMLDLYVQLPLWQKPAFLRDVPVQELRSVLLSRAKNLSQRDDIQRRCLELEINTVLLPQIKNSPHLLAPYGQVAAKWDSYRDKGGFVSDDVHKQAHQKAEASLELHLEKLERSSAGYQLLKFLLENFPNAKQADEWKWKAWLLEPDPEKKCEEAQSFLNQDQHRDEARRQLELLTGKHRQSPYIYFKVQDLLDQSIEISKLQELLKEWKDLEELLKIQHEFSDSQSLDPVLVKKSELIEHAYRSGRLAMLSRQYQRAIQHYQNVLLYDAGSELEAEVRDKIHRINTLKQPMYQP